MRSLEIFNGMEERGTIRDGDLQKPDEYRELIAKCDERILALQ